MFKLTDAMLIDLLGQDFYNYCVQKSNDEAGGVFYDVILAAAIGKIKDHVNLNLGAQVGALGG